MPTPLRWLAIPSLALGLAIPTFSASVGIDEARSVALEFLNGRGASGISLAESPAFTAGSPSAPLYYVFNSTDGSAFVIVSAEDATTPVLGYSFEGAYAPQAAPEPMKWMMEGLERELLSAPSLQSALSASERRSLARKAGERAASKLLSTPDWSQEAPFNNLIPGRPLVGCVGTAMATIMKYHQWPAAGSGSFGGVDFNTSYAWDDMRADNYRSGYTDAEATAVATLMLHASKSIDTQYAMSGSSAYEVRVPGALSTYFGYDPGVSYKKRAEVASQQDWDNLVKAEIDADRPVLYCGQDVTAGHAFVCDGYDGEYLHFNWGWGGSANGYFLSTALNPTVSRTHHYNNLNTVIYNIRPASGTISDWSPVHITADGNQPGIGSDLTNLSSGAKFTVQVGNLKNLAYDDFDGKIAVALCAADGSVKALLSGEANFSLPSMQVLYNGFTKFSNCALPAGTSVADSDRVRIVTKAAGAEKWLPVPGELLTVNELAPVRNPEKFSVSVASMPEGVSFNGEADVIRGWNYSFKALLADPVSDVLTVKANGFVISPDANNLYTISNVREDQVITLLVQKAADVKEKRNVWVNNPGTLSSIISDEESGVIKDLTIFGSIDANDFAFMRDKMRLSRLDISGVYIAANGSNQANAIPREAFRGCSALKEVILPKSVNRLNNGCFRQCGITSIVLPAGIKTYEYNIFVAASALRDIYVGRESAEFINWCVLSGVRVDLATLHVPSERAKANYEKAENWNTIANIIVDPAPTSDNVSLAVAENPDVMFEMQTPVGSVAPGTEVAFSANYTAENDNRMEVYANSTLLSPGADGLYRTNISTNTIIHFELIPPTPVDPNKSVWKLTAANGSIGMFTDAVNVIPGQDFTIRINALEIPQGFEQLYWAIALTDANGNIKEFVSPANVWSAGAGKDFRMNVNCRVNDSQVREGNMLRLVTSAMKKTWNLVEAVGEDMVAALPALNNVTPVYNISVPEVEGVNISGAVATAVRGRDITLKMVPANPAFRLNVKENGKDIASGVASLNHTFIALEDKVFEIEAYDPKADGVAVFNVAPGTFHVQLTEANVAATVVVNGELYSSDIQHATGKDFAINTIKTLDLRGAKIVAQGGYEENVVNHPFFVYPNGMTTPASVVQNILLPDNVIRIASGIFKNCPNMKEITLPRNLCSIGILSASGKSYSYGLGAQAFAGCPDLQTIYIPGEPGERDGKMLVAHFSPMSTLNGLAADYYNLGHPDSKKVTVVVPEEYLSVYQTPYGHKDFGNPWKYFGYNILSDYPVYGLSFDPTRIAADSDLDLQQAASFLMDNVSLESIAVDGKLRLANPDVKCRVYDNGNLVELAEDGTIPVTFYNPAKNPELAGNHHLEVVNFYDLSFSSASPLFSVTEPVVENEAGIAAETFDAEVATAPVLRGVAENSNVKFGVSFEPEHADGLELRVMIGQQELEADADGLYSIDITSADRLVEIFAVPTNGAVLNADELASINPADAAAVTSIGLEGALSDQQLAEAMKTFPALESLDLSALEGDLPENAFAGMESLESVVLPEVETIPAGLFDGCSSLQTIEIPETVNVIGADAFKGCSSLETVRLTGVTEIGEGAFDGCSSLTSLTLLADNASHSGAAVRRRANVHADAFKGINSNCIVILDEGVEVPAAEANYVTTTTGTLSELLPDGTTVEREGRLYSAAGDIRFTAGAPLAIPHKFSFAEGQSVSLSADFGKAAGVVVPFDVNSIEFDGNEVSVILPEARTADPNTASFFAADAEAATLNPVTEISANRPYVAVFSNAGVYTFRAADGVVPATPSDISAPGEEFTLHATYTARELPANEVYLLNSDGSKLVKAGEAAIDPEGGEEEVPTVALAPFTIYASAPVETESFLTGIVGENENVAVDQVIASDGLRIAVIAGELQIWSPDARELKVFSLDGRLVKVLKLEAGLNSSTLPEPGVYLVGNTRILF